jgi:hypothetical protein
MAIRLGKRWLVVGVVLVALGVGAGPFAYIHLVEGKAPPPLTLGSSSPSTGTTASASGDPTGATTGAGTDGT